jgi:twitching motility protein PilJ
MSSASGAVGGRERRGAFNVWIVILLVALGVLISNFYFAARYNAQETAARDRIADIQVQSQRIAKYAQEASTGSDIETFDELEATRRRIQANIDVLQRGSNADGIPAYQGEPAVAAELVKLAETWAPVDANAGRILDSKETVFGLAETVQAFTAQVPQLQTQMDEAVRAMIDSGAPSAQIYIAARQIMLLDRMLRRVTTIMVGGVSAVSAADAFSRDASTFGQLLTGLLNGAPEQGIRRVEAPSARAALTQVNQLYGDVATDVEQIMQASTDLFDVKESADQILIGSDQLLEGARSLNVAFANMPEQRPFPSLLIGIAAGALAVFGIAGLLFTLYRDQVNRYQVTQELNQRNQEAILRLLDEMGSLAEGDLTVRATVTEDITGAIADSINFAIEALRSLVTTINETAVQVAAAAQETQATAMHLAEAAEHQAQQITSASAAINEIAVSIDEVSKNSAESADVAQRSVQIAAKGAEVVRQTIQGMDSIRDQIQETSKRIKRLGESSQEIGSIVELINDIAEQTNILALNAAIQAASAGEAGRGFAVVADEVQRLAERASNATKRIETLVQTIQADTNEAVSSMEQTTAEVVAGARLAEDAGLALGEIEKVSNDLADLIQNISEAARQQSAAATNISATMNVIQEITSQTSMGASQTAESIGNLAQLAADLRRSVADFKLPG